MDTNMKRGFLFRNGLSITFIALFLISMLGQAFFGMKEWNSNRIEEGWKALSLWEYLGSGHFFEATFENFQSEFMQMAAYVILTVFLFQIGSAESKDPYKKEVVDRQPDPSKPDAPLPVRKGGWHLSLYARSLSIAFVGLFLLTWSGHLYGSYRHFNEEQLIKHKQTVDLATFLKEPVFWFESFQNWQSEFLSVASIVLLTIFLRQHGSPESKPVDAAHHETGK